MSVVWKYFTISEKDIKFAVCNVCSAEISRGGAVARHFSTTGLIYHLKTRHPDQHAEYSQTTKLKSPTSTTPSIATAFERVKKFAHDSAKAQDITEKLMEFIALDDQPFSVVEDIGFRRLIEHIEPRYTLPSRRYLAETCLPKMFDRVAKHIHELMSTDIPAISFTTDIWSADVCPTSLLSLTAQWIDTDFNLKNILLHAQKFVGSHTAAAISEAIDTMLETWHIEKKKVHLIVRDNARNMAKAMENSGLQSIPCMAHTLQLAVNEGVLSQRSISEITATGRKIVGHFKHSVLAYSRLQAVQVQFGMPTKRLQQDVATRWNSTYYMLESLIEQKRVLAAYMSDHELPVTLSSHQWMLMENIVSILAPFEQLTKEISSSNATVAEVIPLIAALKRLLAREAQTDDGVKTAKKTLLQAVNTRFEDIECNALYCIATVLDPRFKDHYFDVEKKQRAMEMIQAQLEVMETSGEAEPTCSTEVPGKRSRTSDKEHTPSLSDMVDEILQESTPIHSSPTSSAARQQLEIYLSEQPISRSSNPLDYWCMNKNRFPFLALMARRYLSAPSTSTE